MRWPLFHFDLPLNSADTQGAGERSLTPLSLCARARHSLGRSSAQHPNSTAKDTMPRPPAGHTIRDVVSRHGRADNDLTAARCLRVFEVIGGQHRHDRTNPQPCRTRRVARATSLLDRRVSGRALWQILRPSLDPKKRVNTPDNSPETSASSRSLTGATSLAVSLPWTYISARWATDFRQVSEGFLPSRQGNEHASS
jgi:hypothetical protein